MALAPLTAAPASASIGEEAEHRRITICHRTNSATNPYVVNSPAKMSIVKEAGHDSHDGPVYEPGMKDRGETWGDIIPPFEYYASEKDRRSGAVPMSYPGSDNWDEGGAEAFANGCEFDDEEPPPDTAPEGSISGDCIEATGEFEITGSVEDGRGASTRYRLLVTEPDGTTDLTRGVTDEELEAGIVIDAAEGTTVQLQYARGESDQWTNLDDSVTVEDCPQEQLVQPAGSFSTECIPTGARADIGRDLSEGDFPGGAYVLVSTDFEEQVEEGEQNVSVPAGSTITLEYRQAGTTKVLDTEQSPAACPERGTVDKTSSPVEGSVVAPGSTIDYTVTVTNTGQLTLTDKPVVDTLPSFVTVSGTPSAGGVVSGDGRTITWTVTLAPGASTTLSYTGLVSATAPAGTVLVNEVTFLGQRDTTSHPVGSAALALSKAVSPTGPQEVGTTLTYTLTVSALGNLPQSSVVVTDEIPSGTSYVLGSVVCVDEGTCEPTVANGVVRWELGAMAAGATRTVRFQVTIDVGAAGTDVVNLGSVSSTQVGPTTSNEVRTPVPAVAVLGVKTGQPAPGEAEADAGPLTVVQGTKTGAGVLAATGSGLPLGTVAGLAGLLLLMGVGLIRVAASGPKGAASE